ncbi:MAG: hypothetical protein ACRC1R_00020 [Cetobacterium sp.]|uniref:hypothetical protein n=1 Tax=Cetobacterium sp. TaxID=2071632 RepID=UPI003F38850D
MNFFDIFRIILFIILIIYFWDDCRNSDETKEIRKIKKEAQTKLQNILNTQESFFISASNRNIIFYKDYFRVESKFLKRNNRNIDYNDISFIEFYHKSGDLVIKINLTSTPNEILKFYEHRRGAPSFETFLENYFLVKLFLQKYKKIKVKKGG